MSRSESKVPVEVEVLSLASCLVQLREQGSVNVVELENFEIA